MAPQGRLLVSLANPEADWAFRRGWWGDQLPQGRKYLAKLLVVLAQSRADV